MPSTWNKMKEDVETGWDIVLWSKSYGMGEAAKLAACIYLGCATAYLGQELKDLAAKVGKDLVEKALANKGKIFGAGQFEVEAKDAYYSVYHKVWNPLKSRHEKVTTERFVRLYVRMRRKKRHAENYNYLVQADHYVQSEESQLPEYSGGLVYPVNAEGKIFL
ncbi:hypothetical protein [Lysinibacillus xylanilyticus]|uniref:Uncharacterized protein n=1 Tax=Lysinibacillus xylanilyticus TaxID=582475 RepID=A0A2M9Q5Q8_9BACI|nr:hypothetical protein [Lysinibacillus xylanilyticus]PJO43395.1 hypothetical protein CWD94_12655 [Lysinibacillus xylanilyticus]